jgi:hypothetical protein
LPIYRVLYQRNDAPPPPLAPDAADNPADADPR